MAKFYVKTLWIDIYVNWENAEGNELIIVLTVCTESSLLLRDDTN